MVVKRLRGCTPGQACPEACAHVWRVLRFWDAAVASGEGRSMQCRGGLSEFRQQRAQLFLLLGDGLPRHDVYRVAVGKLSRERIQNILLERHAFALGLAGSMAMQRFG